ncbi:YbaN family protein [Chloroflexota bacterium]
MKDNLKRRLLIIAGTICIGIGILGIFIPLLPTTPFLLLAAACYIRSSSRLYNWLLKNRLLGVYIINYIQGKGITLRAKIFTVILLWVTIGFSLWFITPNLVIRIILVSVAIGVTTHLIRLKTTTDEGS